MTSAPAPQGPLAKVAFVVSLLFVCFFPLCAVGGVLALVDWLRHRGTPTSGFAWRGWAARLNGASLALSLCLLPSLPGFLANRQREKHRECREALVALHARAGEVLDGGLTLEALAATAAPATRSPYTWVLSPTVLVAPARSGPSPEQLARQLERTVRLAAPGVRDGHATFACVGDTDGDAELDILSISTAPRWEHGLLEVEPGRVAVNQKDFGARDEVETPFAPRDAGF